MKTKNSSQQKDSRTVSQELGNLLQEAESQISSWGQDPNLLLPKLIALPSSAQENFFDSILKKKSEGFASLLGALCGKNVGLDIALAKSLGNWAAPESGALLHRLVAQSSSRSLQKAVRRSIFRLKSQGIKVEEIGDSSPAIYRPPQLPHPSGGYLSSIDAAGSRLVWLTIPKDSQGIRAVTTLVSDTQGVVDFNVAETSRKGFEEYLAGLQTKMPWEIVEADTAYCHGLILEAVAMGKKQDKPLPREFHDWQPLLGPAPTLPLKPLIYQFLSEGEVKTRPDLLDRSPSLFQLPLFQAWIMGKEELDKYLKLLTDASSSRLILAPHQQESRFFEIYRLAVHEFFEDDRRLLYRRRLEEMAYLLWKKGKDEEARMSLAAAVTMTEESQLLSPHPFLLELVKRSLQIQLDEEKEKQEKERDLIIRP